MYYLICILALFIFGIFIGNFLTPIFFRLPRGITPAGFDSKSNKPPFCSQCNHPLKFYEYLPILSWITTLGKCNYCKHPIDKNYFFIEIISGFIAVFSFTLISEDIDLAFIIFIFLLTIMLAIAITLNNQLIFTNLTAILIIEGMIYQTLISHSIVNWLLPMSLNIIVSLLLLKFSTIKDKSIPLTHTLIPASIWCESIVFFIIYLPLATLSFTLYYKLKRKILYYYIMMLIFLTIIVISDLPI